MRAHYSTNDIDKLSRQAMLERRLMTRASLSHYDLTTSTPSVEDSAQ